MPSGMPAWMTAGGHGGKPIPVVTSLTLSRNGNEVTLAKGLAEQGVRTVEDYRAWLKSHQREPHTLGIVHPASMHNLLLRYWLAANAIDPDRDVRLQTLPPAQMLADLKDGSIDGYCIGEPWNYRAARDGHGFPIVGIWRSGPATPARCWGSGGLGAGLSEHPHRPHQGPAGGLPMVCATGPLARTQ